MKKLAFYTFLLSTQFLSAQLSEIEIKTGVSFPVGDFRTNHDKELYGVGANVMFSSFNNQFFEYGFGVQYDQMNSIKGEVPIFINDIPSRGEQKITSNQINTELKGRLIPYRGTVQPYIEIDLGANTYYTKSEITTQIGYYDNNEQVVNKTVQTSKGTVVDGMNFYIGWTGGAKFKLSENLLINASVSRIYTNEGRYLDVNSVDVTSKGTISYGLNQSRTSQFRTSLGLVFQF